MDAHMDAHIVPLTAEEEPTAEPTVGELGLCGPVGTEGSCSPGCCPDPKGRMTREQAKADAEESTRATTFVAIPLDDSAKFGTVEITEPGAMAKLAELLGAPMSILLQAEKITNGARQIDYGTALDNHERIARFWTAFLLNLGIDAKLSPEHVAEMMILMKIARVQRAVTEDGLVDIAGYANVIDKIGQQRRERAARLADEL